MRRLALLVVLLASAVARAQDAPPRDVATSEVALEKITLREAIRRALQRNPAVEVALDEVRRARGQLEQTRGASLPTIYGNGLFTRIDHDRVLSTPATATTPAQNILLTNATSVSINATAAVPVLAPRAWASWAEASENVRVVNTAVGGAQRQIAITVAAAYLAIIERRREVELNVRARDTAKAHFDYTHARLLGGRGSRLDDVRAEQELEGDEAAVESTRLAVVRAQEALGVLVAGVTALDTAEEPWLAEIARDQAFDEAQRRRADLLQLRATEHLARRVAREDFTSYLPSLTASFAPIYSYPGTIFTPTISWQAQLTLTMPFYDGGVREGLLRQHHALIDEAAANLAGLERQAASDVRVGSEAVRRNDEALRRARHAAQLAHDAVKIAELSYEAGATTNIELIDAERRARDADTAAAVLEDAARQARIDLMFAAGELP